MTQQKQMKAFVSADDMIHTTEVLRKQLKQYEGQEDRIKYLTDERNSYRTRCDDLSQAIGERDDTIWRLNRKVTDLNGEVELRKGLLDQVEPSVVKEEKPRFAFIKRIAGLTAIVVPYALIGSYVVSLYI